VRWEQELARLFVRSGWTQGWLAVAALGTVNSCGGLVDAGARTEKCGGNERRVSSGPAGVRRESLGLDEIGLCAPFDPRLRPEFCAPAAHHMMHASAWRILRPAYMAEHSLWTALRLISGSTLLSLSPSRFFASSVT
jgi:hypothetical protein